MAIMLKKFFFGISGFGPAFLCSLLLPCYGGNLQNPLYKASSYVLENGTEPVNSASLLAHASSSWVSILSWTCLALIVLLAVFLILWSLASFSASWMPELAGRKGPAAGWQAANRTGDGDIGKSRLSAIDSVNGTRLAQTLLAVPSRNGGHAA